MLRRVAIVALVLAALPATAQASTVGRQGEIITYTGTDGVVDIFDLAENGVDIVFNVNVAGPTNGCGFRNSTTELGCPKAGLAEVDLNLGDRNDEVTMNAASPLPYSPKTVLHGGAGDDRTTMGDEFDVLFGDDGNDHLFGNGGNDNLFGGPGDDELDGGAGPQQDFLDGGAGDDTFLPPVGPDFLGGGDGTDTVIFGAGNDTITRDGMANDGTPGQNADVDPTIEIIDGGGGADTIVGGANTDTLRGGAGADDLRGGAGIDQVSYPEAAAQRIMLDELANDGAPGEGDNVHGDLETIAAGPGNDTLVGNAGPNTLDGGTGNDTLTGGAGNDALLGGAGDDAIFARDGVTDTVDCGPDGGTATVDTIDVVTGCTRVIRGDDAQPDLDRDGVDRPPRGPDCNDRDPAIRPGAREIVNNAVDENCDGRADFDRDLDGVKAPPGGRDCNDTERKIHPGAREIPGNRIDENCDGKAAPFPRLESSVGAFFITIGEDTRFTDFFVRRARGGSKLRLLCDGPGCRWKTRTVKVKRDRRKISLMRQVRGLVLRPGARIDVRITKRRTIGGAIRFVFRDGKPPARRDQCLFPGRKRPGRCPG